MRLAAIAATLILPALAGCAPPPAIRTAQLEGWSVVEGPGGRLVADLPPAEIQRFADDLALFDANHIGPCREAAAADSQMSRWRPPAVGDRAL
jgi:hypothetical protein